MSKAPSPQLQASGGRKRKHTCAWRPEDAALGEGCPRLTRCLQELHPFGPCALIRFHLRSDGSAALPFATSNYEDVQLLPFETVRHDAHTVFPLLHPEDFDRVTISMTQAAREIRPWLSEYRILHPQTGELRWLRSCLVPYQGTQDDLVGYGLQANVTGEKQFYAAVLDLCRRTSVGVFRTTMQGRYLSVNQQFANICGYDSPKDLLSASVDISTQFYMHPGERKVLIDLLKAHGSIQRYALETRTKGGGSRWVSLNMRVVKNAKGHIDCCEGSCADITEEVRRGLAQGRFAELTHTSFGEGEPFPQKEEKPAGNAPDGLCHLLTYVRDAILWRLNLSELR